MSRALHFPQVPTDYCNYSQILYHFTYSSSRSVPRRDYVCKIHREVETLSAPHIRRANFSRKVLFRFRCPGFAFMHFIIINNTGINTIFFFKHQIIFMSFGTNANYTHSTCKPTIIVRFARISGIISIINIYETSSFQPPILYRLKIINSKKY